MFKRIDLREEEDGTRIPEVGNRRGKKEVYPRFVWGGSSRRGGLGDPK